MRLKISGSQPLCFSAPDHEQENLKAEKKGFADSFQKYSKVFNNIQCFLLLNPDMDISGTGADFTFSAFGGCWHIRIANACIGDKHFACKQRA